MEHFLSIADLSPLEIQGLLNLASRLNTEWLSVQERSTILNRLNLAYLGDENIVAVSLSIYS